MSAADGGEYRNAARSRVDIAFEVVAYVLLALIVLAVIGALVAFYVQASYV